MQIITSHVNTDFDALASMFAAKKLYPNAQVVISDKKNMQVKQFLTIYRDTLDYISERHIDWTEVTELILVDVASYSRIGNYANQIDQDNVSLTIYDHHPPSDKNADADFEVIEPVGATVTLLIEEIMKRNLPISSFEATLFGLGIYTDTGFFTYENTTLRDFEAASFLMEHGMNLDMIQRFSDHALLPEQQELLNHLFSKANKYEINGLQIVVSSHQMEEFQGGLAIITQKLLDIGGADAVLTVVKMKKHVYVVGRANASRINLLPLLKKFGGGGHEQAGSATIKKGDLDSVTEQVTGQLELMLKPAITARDMMASPVKTLLPETKIEEAGRLMYRYGHSGYPVVEDDKLLGVITRRDLDKANHHGLGHAPVKAYMSTNVFTIGPEATIEEIQKLIIKHNIGRLPVMEDGKPIGIVTRTNIIEVLHNQEPVEDMQQPLINNLQAEMKQQLPSEIYSLLKDISKTAETADVSAYLIGGIVRDIFLKQPNDDIDIVIEGDGIAFAKQLQADYGGDVIVHESFGTATWEHPSKLKIDVTSARLEYYERPASLPDVELSTLNEDLYRRDFTINAMAICLNTDVFGQLVDPFRGQADLWEKQVKVLHNLSFIEDPTRILRAVRFETRFGFLMDKQTEELALHSIDKVNSLSANRIIDEMKRLFQEENPMRVMHRLFELQFWQQFGVSAEKIEPCCTHAKQFYKIYGKYPSLKETDERNWFHYFVIPFYNGGSADAVKQFALTKQDTAFLRDITGLKEIQDWQHITKLGDFQRLLKNYSDEAILFLLARENLSNESIIIDYLEKRRAIPSLLTGDDLIQEGLKPGAAFAEILLELEVAILNREVETKDEALSWLRNS